MSGWKSGKEILEENELYGFQLLEFVKNGLQPHSAYGQTIPPPNISRKREKLNKLTWERERQKPPQQLTPEQLANLSEEAKFKYIGSCFYWKERRQHHFERIEREIKELQGQLEPFDSDTWTNYQFKGEKEIAEAVQVLEASLFKRVDVERLRENQEPLKTAEDEATQGAEDFIRSLKISCKSDSEIIIKAPRKSQKTYVPHDLGFRNAQTKEWQALCAVILDPPHTYFVGKSGHHRQHEMEYRDNLSYEKAAPGVAENSEYDRKQKMLQSINRKLVDFFERAYGLNIDDDFKCYELCPNEHPGTYRFIFRIESEYEAEPDYSSFSIDDLRTERKRLADRLLKSENQLDKNKIIIALNALKDAAKSKKCVNRVFLDGELDGDLEIGRDASQEE